MNNIKKYLALACLLFAVIACGPIYDTKYSYQAPYDNSGKHCVNSCDSMKQKCVSGCNDREQNCEIASNNMDTITNIYQPKDKDDKYKYTSSNNLNCSSASCKKDCKNQYDQCFVNCGGAVTSHQVCVAFCN